MPNRSGVKALESSVISRQAAEAILQVYASLSVVLNYASRALSHLFACLYRVEPGNLRLI